MALEWGVAALVLLTAILHASWNAVVKSSGDQLLTLTVVFGTGAVLAGAAMPFVEVPARAAWPYLALSVIVHGLYSLFLLLSYRFGDLSHVYPIARGLGPLLVALLSAMLAGEVPSPLQTAALVLVSLAIASLAFGQGWSAREDAKPVVFAVATGILIGTYTFLDGQGARHAGSSSSYIAWLIFINGMPLVVASFLRTQGRVGLIAGLISALGYAIVIWAMSRSPMALVASLRETSVIFGALIGAVLLGEPFGRRRVLAAAVVAAGVMMLSLTA
jgi:drug/metabolite transporter (DMT)-like permease